MYDNDYLGVTHVESILTLNHVSFSVPEKDILKDVQLTIKPGDFITIYGPSGSGKSTLLKLIGTLLTPTAGEIQYKGQAVSELPITEYRQAVSYVFQSPQLFGETVLDNLSFPYEIRQKEFDKDRALMLLKEVQLDESYLNKAITELSGGEKQRIALVRHLLILPDVLLLDEITSALDEANRLHVQAFIKRLQEEKGLTVLWITHQPQELEQSNRHIEVVDGIVKEVEVSWEI